MTTVGIRYQSASAPLRPPTSQKHQIGAPDFRRVVGSE